MANASIILAIVRAGRPIFRNRHDRLAYATHATITTEGYFLTAAGSDADSFKPGDEVVEVSVDGWNALEDYYSFRYHNKESGSGLLVRMIAMEDKLLCSALRLPSTPQEELASLELSVLDFTTESADYSAGYKNLDNLVTRVKSLLPAAPAALPANAQTQAPTPARTTFAEEIGQPGRDPLRVPQAPRTAAPRPAGPEMNFGDADRFGFVPGLIDPHRAGNLMGPDNPMFTDRPGYFPPHDPHHPRGVPPGARYDPIGPVGVPGFEPERFQPRSNLRDARFPGNHPDLPARHGRDDGIL